MLRLRGAIAPTAGLVESAVRQITGLFEESAWSGSIGAWSATRLRGSRGEAPGAWARTAELSGRGVPSRAYLCNSSCLRSSICSRGT
jgi:hypothetical protein